MTELHYTREHEWVAIDGEVATVGITPFAAERLGTVVYADLPAAGTLVTAGKVAGEIESTKSVGEIYAPVDGEVIESNQAVVDDPASINADPLAAWLMKLRMTSTPTLLTADEYAALTAN